MRTFTSDQQRKNNQYIIKQLNQTNKLSITVSRPKEESFEFLFEDFSRFNWTFKISTEIVTNSGVLYNGEG